MTDATTNEREKLFAEQKGELLKRQLVNSDNFDKAIMSYSSAGLAFSLAFLKDFIPITVAYAPLLLYLSWALFVLATLVTLASFLTSQSGIAKQLRLIQRYYLACDDAAAQEPNLFAVVTEHLAYAAGTTFCLALICTTLFVSLNLERSALMKAQYDSPKHTPAVTAQYGAPVPGVQPISGTAVQRGAPVPGIQPVPAPAQQPGQGSTGTGSSGSGSPQGANP